jgi:hypothetical protein
MGQDYSVRLHVCSSITTAEVGAASASATAKSSVHNGKIIDVEVYFGWTIPHEAADGGFVNPEKL